MIQEKGNNQKCEMQTNAVHVAPLLQCRTGGGTDNKARYTGIFYFILFFCLSSPTSATESEVAEMSISGFEKIHLRDCFTS